MSIQRKTSRAVSPATHVVTHLESEINRKIKHLLRVIDTVEVVNDESDKAIVSSVIRESKQLIKQVSVARKAITTPLQEKAKQWIAKEKELVAPIEKAIAHADQLIQQFNAKVTAQQQAVLDRIDEGERAQLQAEDGDVEALRQQSEFKRQIAIAQHSTEGVRKVWTFEAQNLANVPREYLMLNEKKVRQAIRSGERHIPGLMIFQKQQTVYH
ncbi:hypothetical protein [Tunicatimonas pelagia]|uniref:hypothetical protein n=1 Tax=Tunicatimonas pelagia TaxID=931531 RepID=UPI002665F0E1|nr:hypothetical protein [Tunicatimonas pelagia]WKN44903.1 hypothetical protein P0M28_08000 [Tunicatimonas pelagia]